MKRLFTSLCTVLLSIAAWAQGGQTVTMELTDVYGDKTQVEVKGGSTFYLSQAPWGNYWQYTYNAGERYGHLVVCDKEGVPYYTCPMTQLSSISYKNYQPPTSQPENQLEGYVAHTDGLENVNQLEWRVGGKDYAIRGTGEWTLDESLSSLTLTTIFGEKFPVALSTLDHIRRCEPGAGLSQYLQENLTDANVYRWAFYNGSTTQDDYMSLHFYARVPSYEEGEKNITLLVPTDEAMTHYVDPVSFDSRNPRVLNLSYYSNASFPIRYTQNQYYSEEGMVGPRAMVQMSNAEITNRLRMMLCSHALVHQTAEERALGLRCGNEYFQSMDGSVVRVVKDAEGNPVGVQGTFEMDNERKGLTDAINGSDNTPLWSLTQCHFTETLSKGNAVVYKLDNPMNATPRSAYSVLSTDSAFSRFLELCYIDQDMLRACGLVDGSMSRSKQQTMQTRYEVFVSKNGMDYNLNVIGHRPFTIFVPTNEAIEAEVAKHQLPTWEEIAAQYEALPKDEEGSPILSHADSIALQDKCMKLVNFVRAHIQFGLDIADQLPFEREHNTTIVKPATLSTPRLTVRGLGKGRMTVTDETGQTLNVLDAKKNIFVRDIECNMSPVGRTTMTNLTVDGYTNGVIHQIDGVLKYKEN